MEYLMTYGWAILIIAVVLGVLFQLGVFSGSALTPKAAPGACQVVRLGGQASLEGECQGQLPQYVAQFSSPTGLITAATSGSTTAITVSFWYYLPSWSNTTAPYPQIFAAGNYLVYFGMSSDKPAYVDLRVNLYANANSNVYPGSWTFFTGTYNGVTVTAYNNGQAHSTAPSNIPIGSYGTMVFGIQGNNYVFLNSEIANIQVYNVSLNANEVEALYLEGIGGAPIKIQNLVGWWPLNGNAQDYSGNNNNGQIISNVVFNSTWQRVYTPP
jgi:hypothetical protein